jgi:hypothetical protein
MRVWHRKAFLRIPQLASTQSSLQFGSLAWPHWTNLLVILSAIYVAPDDYPPNVTLMLGKQAVVRLHIQIRPGHPLIVHFLGP